MTDDNEPQEVEVDPEHRDFALGYEMGSDSVELMSKHVQAMAAEHEPLILIGMMTNLMECAYRACMTVEDAEEMIRMARDLAQNQAGIANHGGEYH
jgi:hypothetical protein